MITFEELEALGFEKAIAVVLAAIMDGPQHITDPGIRQWVEKHAWDIVRWKQGKGPRL